MTTDGPWTDAVKAFFETVLGIPANVPTDTRGLRQRAGSNEIAKGTRWVEAVEAINLRYLFLDPDVGFFSGIRRSEKKLLLSELALILDRREAVIIYRHQYWPNIDGVPACAYPYVWHGLNMLRTAGFSAFAYQSQAASVFFVCRQELALAHIRRAFQDALAGVSAAVIERRIVG